MEKIIIDNVDVSLCEYLDEDIANGCCTNPILKCPICKGQECEYKQIKILEQEKEQLKKENKLLKGTIRSKNIVAVVEESEKLKAENELLKELKDEDSLRIAELVTENQKMKKNYEHLIAYIKEDLVPYAKELEHSLEKIRIIAMPECPYFERAKNELCKIVNKALEG